MLTSGHVINCTGRSQATGRKRTSEDLLHPNETSVDKRVPRLKSLGSSDALATFSTSMFQENNKSTPVIINAQPACSSDTSPAVHGIDSIVVSKGGCEADKFTTTGSMVQLDLNTDKQLTSTSRQNSLHPGNIFLSITASQAPSDLLSCTALLSSLLDQSVCKPPTLSLEEHIRQCEAMTDRVKGAGQIISSPSIFSVPLSGIPEVDLNSESKPLNLAPGSLAVESRGNQVDVNSVTEAPDDTEPPSAEKLVTLIPSSSKDKSPCLLDLKDADEDYIANRAIVEVRRSSRLNSSRQAKSPSLSSSQHLGGDNTASTRIIDVSKSSRKRPSTSNSGGGIPNLPPASISGGKITSLADSQDADADDVVITQIIEVPMEIEPLQMIELPTIPSFDSALKTTHAAGLGMEFEDQISEALEKLKRAQAAEYARAEESLRAQKKNVIEQYRQLEKVCGQFAKKKKIQLSPHRFRKHLREKPRAEFDHAMNRLMAQYGKAQEGQKVFESMLAISDGFGQVSKEFLRDFFKWPPSDITEA